AAGEGKGASEQALAASEGEGRGRRGGPSAAWQAVEPSDGAVGPASGAQDVPRGVDGVRPDVGVGEADGASWLGAVAVGAGVAPVAGGGRALGGDAAAGQTPQPPGASRVLR